MENHSGQEATGNGDIETERSAGRGRGRGHRANDESLRRPHQPSGAASSEVVKKSELRADAAEFVPKFFTAPTQPHAAPSSRGSVQERLRMAREGPNVHHAMVQRQQQHQFQQQQFQQQQDWQQYQQYPEAPYQGVPYQQYNQYPVIQNYAQYGGGGGGGGGQYDGGYAGQAETRAETAQAVDLPTSLSQLENAIKTLTMDPGKFDSLVAHLVNIITPFIDQTTEFQEIFSLIIQQSINEGNFRYSGARLCTHLDTVAADKPSSVFRDILIKTCKQKTEEQAETWQQITKHTDVDEKRCHGLIFFLAELVTQMETGPASELGKLLIKLINTVLQNPAPSSAKNICQALKLAGQTLERDNSGNRADMEQVMRTLSDLVIQGRVDQSVGRMVTSVTELRSGNWGVTSSNAPSIVESKQSSSQVADEPIFYGPDGQVLTEEESQFLDDHVEELGSQEPWENDEEDDMIAEAYEEFLQISQNKNKTNQKNVQSRNSKEH